MAKVYLTDRMVRTLEAGSGRAEVWDTVVSGLGLRYSGRKKSWFYVFHSPESRDSQGRRRRRRITVGEYPAVSLAEARGRAAELRETVRRGVDPVIEHRPEPGDGMAFRDLAAEFLQTEAKTSNQLRHHAYALRSLLPVFGDRLVVSLKRSEIVDFLNRQASRGKSVPPSLLKSLQRILQWGALKYDLPGNPARGVLLPTLPPRDRVLTATEVHRLWQVCSRPPASLTSLLLRLRLVTAQRGAQLRSMKTCQLERNALGLWWNVPSEITKSGKPNRVYLSPLAEAVLATAQPSADGWIFGQAPPKTYFTGSKEAIHRIRRAVGGRSDWRAMDLRRTAATWMAQRGVTRFIVKRVLGHTDREITAVYDLYTYDQEVKDAVLILEKAIREAIGRPTVATSAENVAAEDRAVAESDDPSILDLYP